MTTPFDGTLLENFIEQIVLLDETTAPDGYGGVTAVWADGATVTVAITQPHDNGATIANAIVGKQSITIVTGTNIDLKRDKYFRRVKNGKTYRIERDNTEKIVPDDSELQWRYTTATEAALPEKP